MGKIVFGMLQSLDGYIEAPSGDLPPPPGPIFSRFSTDQIRGSAGFLEGRRMYEIMRYWDQDQPDWDEGDHDFARVWRSKPKWVASRSLTSVGPNATLIQGNLIDFAAKLKAETDGQIDVAGPDVARQLSAAGLIDEFHLHLRPYVSGGGKPFFQAALPALRLLRVDSIGEDAVHLVYAPA